MRWSMRAVTEPGGAAAFAALLSGRYKPQAGERVAVLLCGANTTVVRDGPDPPVRPKRLRRGKGPASHVFVSTQRS
jgi:hypothetical protein